MRPRHPRCLGNSRWSQRSKVPLQRPSVIVLCCSACSGASLPLETAMTRTGNRKFREIPHCLLVFMQEIAKNLSCPVHPHAPHLHPSAPLQTWPHKRGAQPLWDEDRNRDGDTQNSLSTLHSQQHFRLMCAFPRLGMGLTVLWSLRPGGEQRNHPDTQEVTDTASGPSKVCPPESRTLYAGRKARWLF